MNLNPVEIKEDGWGTTKLTTRSSSRKAIAEAIAKFEAIGNTLYEPSPFSQKLEPAAARFYADQAFTLYLVAEEAWLFLADIAATLANLPAPPVPPSHDEVEEYIAEIKSAADKYAEQIEQGE